MTQFIHQQFLKDVSICDRLIQAHKDYPDKWQGRTGGGLDVTQKDSTDSLLENPLYLEYALQLQDVVDEYIKLYPECNMYNPWTIVEGVNIQHYRPNGGYKAWHCERGSIKPYEAARHLVFMTYLNDVTDAGGTEFSAQKLTINAEKGKTVIWPADWTHTHRGIVSPTQDKYIVTGWFSFIK
jgi:hypothetical protein